MKDSLYVYYNVHISLGPVPQGRGGHVTVHLHWEHQYTQSGTPGGGGLVLSTSFMNKIMYRLA